MLKPTRTILALAAGSLTLGLVGAGPALAVGNPTPHGPGLATVLDDDDYGQDYDGYPQRRHARGIVVSHGPLTVRSRPSTYAHKVGTVNPHEKLVIECKKHGERVDGNSLWYLLRDDENDPKGRAARRDDDGDLWVAARYVKNLTEVRYCHS